MAPSLKEFEDEEYVNVWAQMLNLSKEKVRDLLGVEPKELSFEFEEQKEEVRTGQTEE
jgi:hypothetical protein